jgi:hypothetical protein
MIHITLSREHSLEDPSADPLGRDRVGFKETMSPAALYDANHGTWVLGARAWKERYALFTFGGVVQQAVEISSIEKVIHRESTDTRDDRSVIHGTILEAGHPVYDRYVGKASPVQGVRNPVTYFDDNIEDATSAGRPCRCGCGGVVASKDFLPGHDQTALHARVKQIGTVAEFLDWFDIVRGARPATVD